MVLLPLLTARALTLTLGKLKINIQCPPRGVWPQSCHRAEKLLLFHPHFTNLVFYCPSYFYSPRVQKQALFGCFCRSAWK